MDGWVWLDWSKILFRKTECNLTPKFRAKLSGMRETSCFYWSHTLSDTQICNAKSSLQSRQIVTSRSQQLHSTGFQTLRYPVNHLNAQLNPICHLLVLLGAHHILHVSRIRVKSLSADSWCSDLLGNGFLAAFQLAHKKKHNWNA